ncbi:restriction endonuclease subunit S [Shewanella algae]|uniref:restriction endonuclease subunit S n=1 Tax=Shewanella algae TaxID=38313 RepID=UPI001AAD5EC4|nr:restriction endonuclease subunit S [Shewanella algae]MBO2560454.1 restriction endonuclease subunit S [Shewanella algae]
MESEFAYRQLKDCATWYSGGTPRKSSPEYWNGEIPWISAKSLSGTFISTSEDKVTELGAKNGTRLLPKDSILFVVRGMSLKSEFRVGITTQEVTFNQDLKALVAKDDIDPHFLMYSLKSKTHEILGLVEEAGHGTGVLPTPVIQQLEIPVPTLSTQKAIAKAIWNFDQKITLNHQINQTLEQMAQTLFKSWFVDFDPVIDNALDAGFFEQDWPIPDELQHRAEARKAARESEGFKPSPDDVRQLFPDAFEESELGWVPRGWVVSTAGDEFTVKGGSTPSTKSAEFWKGGDIHWTSPKDLSGKAEKILLDTERKITAIGLSKITSGLLPPETVLMSSRAPVGYLAMTKIPVAINQGYIAITESKSLTQEFALYWLDSKIEMIKSISGGTTFAEISKKTFRTIPIVVPSAQSVNAFSETVALYLSKISNNVEECSSLSVLRDSLLPKLISGELEII